MSNKKPNKKLSPKHKQFCKEYIIDLNATQAYIRTGYASKNPHKTASILLTKQDIQAEIQVQLEARAKRTHITADRVIQEIANIALIKESEFYNEDGSVKYLSQLTPEQRASLTSYQFKTVKVGDDYEEVPVFRVQDKMKALEMLGKHFGIFEKDNSQSKPDAVTTIVRVYE